MKSKTGWDNAWQLRTPPFRSTVVSLAPPPNRLDRLEFGLVGGAVFLSPMNFLRHPSYYITLGDVFTLACLLVMLVNRTISLRPFGSGTLFWMIGLILFLGGLLISSFVNGDALRGLVVSAQYFTAYFILPLVILSRPRWQVAVLVKIFVLSIFIMCVHGIYLIHIVGETHTRFVSPTGRLKSFVERTNECASLIALTLPLLFWLFGTGQIRRVVFWICFLILSYGILLTGSVTGLLGMFFASVAYFLLTMVTSWRRFALGLAGAVALIAIIGALGGTLGKDILPPIFQTRVLGALVSGNIEQAGSFTHRYQLILEAQRIVDDAILLGFGADQYRVLSQWGQPVHNAYLLIWSEGGLFALIGLLLIIIAGFWALPSTVHQAGSWVTVVCTFCSISLFALLINAIPHVYGRFWPVPVLLAVAASLAHAREGPIAVSRAGFTDGRL